MENTSLLPKNDKILKRVNMSYLCSELFTEVKRHYPKYKHNRRQENVFIRMATAVILNKGLGASTSLTGGVLGIDHSTVIYLVRKHNDNLSYYDYKDTYLDVLEISKNFLNRMEINTDLIPVPKVEENVIRMAIFSDSIKEIVDDMPGEDFYNSLIKQIHAMNETAIILGKRVVSQEDITMLNRVKRVKAALIKSLYRINANKKLVESQKESIFVGI
jgi:hypothetical protein